MRGWLILPERSVAVVSVRLILCCWLVCRCGVSRWVLLPSLCHRAHPMPAQQQHHGYRIHVGLTVRLQPELLRHLQLHAVSRQLVLRRRPADRGLPSGPVLACRHSRPGAVRVPRQLAPDQRAVHLRRWPAQDHQPRQTSGRLGVQPVPCQQRVRQRDGVPVPGRILVHQRLRDTMPCQYVLPARLNGPDAMPLVLDRLRRVRSLHLLRRLRLRQQHLHPVPCEPLLHRRGQERMPCQFGLQPRLAVPCLVRMPSWLVFVPVALHGRVHPVSGWLVL